LLERRECYTITPAHFLTDQEIFIISSITGTSAQTFNREADNNYDKKATYKLLKANKVCLKRVIIAMGFTASKKCFCNL
jgi:hypothetical protein